MPTPVLGRVVRVISCLVACAAGAAVHKPGGDLRLPQSLDGPVHRKPFADRPEIEPDLGVRHGNGVVVLVESVAAVWHPAHGRIESAARGNPDPLSRREDRFVLGGDRDRRGRDPLQMAEEAGRLESGELVVAVFDGHGRFFGRRRQPPPVGARQDDLEVGPHRGDRQAHRVFAEFAYKAKSWDRERRVVGKAEHLPGGDDGKANPRYVVTNLAGDARHLYEDVYCQRGEAENRIKEQQLMLFADRTSCHKFVANQFRVLLAAAAYVLVSHLRRVGLAGTDHATATVQTIRLKLFKVGAWVQRSVRRWAVRMSCGYPWAELFASVARRLSGPRFVGSS